MTENTRKRIQRIVKDATSARNALQTQLIFVHDSWTEHTIGQEIDSLNKIIDRNKELLGLKDKKCITDYDK